MYLKGVRSGLEIVAPGLGGFYDGQHLFVMNRIILFGRGHASQKFQNGDITTYDSRFASLIKHEPKQYHNVKFGFAAGFSQHQQ